MSVESVNAPVAVTFIALGSVPLPVAAR